MGVFSKINTIGIDPQWTASACTGGWLSWILSMGVLLSIIFLGFIRLVSVCRVQQHFDDSSNALRHNGAVPPPMATRGDDFAMQLHKSVDVNALIADIYKKASLNGMVVSSINSAVQGVGASAILGKTGINMKMSGAYFGLIKVLTEVLSTQAGMAVQKISISRDINSSNAPQPALGLNNVPASSPMAPVSATISLVQWTRPVP